MVIIIILIWIALIAACIFGPLIVEDDPDDYDCFDSWR